MRSQSSIQAGPHTVRLEGDPGSFDARLDTTALAAGLHEVGVKLSAPQASTPPEIKVIFQHPIRDVQARWIPVTRAMPGLLPEWDCAFTSQMTRDAPVACLYSLDGNNRVTLACSECVLPVEIRAGVNEESAGLNCSVRLFHQPHDPIECYEMRLRIDTREVPYYTALAGVSRWWEERAGHVPMAVPDSAKVPFYSTWYSFHQSLVVDEVLDQCRLARELGCEAIIIDDGWQTKDTGRGYPFTGDWAPVRLGDMRRFVDAVHETGLKCLLWYALPFAGKESRIAQRFAGKTLTWIEGANTWVLDPRFPEVREYLLHTFESAVRDWHLDGFKLDFIDWLDPGKGPAGRPAGADMGNVNEAAQLLLGELMKRLRAIHPEIIIEFRQPYIGPAMRRYANMFRAVDCPNDALTNRINTLDLRLLCGKTAVHSDMFMWNRDEPVEAAALQLLNVLFAVPQVSVLIDRLSDGHRAMLKFWLGFWREHRDVLLDGELAPLHPEAWYPVVTASNDTKRVVAVYGDVIVPGCDGLPDDLYIVNATRSNRIALDLPEAAGRRTVDVFDFQGRQMGTFERAFGAGIHTIDVPPSGLVQVRRAD